MRGVASLNGRRPSVICWFFLTIVLTRGPPAAANEGAKSVNDVAGSLPTTAVPSMVGNGESSRAIQPRLAAVSSTTLPLQDHQHREQEETRVTDASVSSLSLLERDPRQPTLTERPVVVYPPTHPLQQAGHVLQAPKENKKRVEEPVQVKQPTDDISRPQVEAQGPAEPEEEPFQSRAKTARAELMTAIWNNLFQPPQDGSSATVNRVNSPSTTVNRVNSPSTTVNRVNNNILHDLGEQPVHTRPAPRQDDGPHFGVIGGAGGNPGLYGVPASLGYPNNYLIPIHDKITTTTKPIYSEAGEDLRLHHPLIFGDSFNGLGSQQFSSVGHQMPGHNSQRPLPAGSLGSPTQNAPDDNLSLQEYLSRLTTMPRSSSTLTPSTLTTQSYIEGVTSFFYPTQSPLQTQNNPSQLLGEYYANFANSNPTDEQTSPDRLDLQSNPGSVSVFAETPFIPAFSNIQTSLGSNFVTNLEEEPVVPVPATLSSSSTSVQGCFSSTLCILTLATVLALGLTTAFVSPFFGPGLPGRRKRSTDYVILSEDSATALVNYYATHLSRESLNVPLSEQPFLNALHDAADDSTRGLFTRLQHFIMNKRHKLLNNTIREAQSKEHLPLQDKVLEKPSASAQPQPPPGSEAWGTPVNKQENLYSPRAFLSQRSARHTDAKDTHGSPSRPSLTNAENPSVVVHLEPDTHRPSSPLHEHGSTAGAAISPLTLPHHMTGSSPVSSGASYHGWSLANASAWPRKPHTSNHHMQSVNTAYSSSSPTAGGPPHHYHATPDFVSPHSGPASLTHRSPAHVFQQLPQRKGSPPGRRAVSFYRAVCSALHHPHTPYTDVTRFIADKCNLLHIAGII